jgi:hypothetical protein
VFVSQRVLELYSDYQQTGNQTSKQYLINNADWLVKNSRNYGNYSLLEYYFPYPTYEMPVPWRSGMAQGQGIQAMICAYKITNNTEYLDVAKLFLNSFFVEVKDGGVTYKNEEGWWYEEYSHENGTNPHVLNGMMFSVLGIYDYYQLTNDSESKFLFERGISSLKHNLPKFDRNAYSNYDILGNVASKYYHDIHISQTQQLYDITAEKIFIKFNERWKKCDDLCRLWEFNTDRIEKIFFKT